MSFFHDIATDLHLQRIADATRRAFETAALTAIGQKPLADLVSSIASQHPHLTPGITMALANVGYGPNHPLTQSASDLAAQRKIQNGIGWNSIGDNVNPTHAGLLDIPGIHFPEAIGTTLAAAANGISTAIDKTAKTISAPVAPTLRIIGATALSGGQLLDAAVRRVATNSSDNSLKNELLETTLGQSVKSLAGGRGLALGHGFLPTGPATQAATKSSAATQSLTYADHPYFSLHDDPNVQASPHVATTGRIVAKTIIEPGSPLFSLVSGVIDAAKTVILDPVSKLTEHVGEAGEARKPFSPTDLGPSTPQVGPAIDPFGNPEGYKAQQLLIEGNRKTIATVPTENWLTEDPVGRATVDKYASEPSAYQIWRMSGGLDGNMTPALAHSLSQVSTPEDVRGILGPALGIDLLDKPATTRLGLAATDLGIRDRLDSIRLFNNVPDAAAVDLEDHQQVAKQLVLNLRNAKAPQDLIESSFNKMAAASTDIDRMNVWHDALNIDLPRHIATTDLTGPLGSLDRNFNRLRGAFQDETAWDQITRAQIANKNPIMGVMLDGQESPLRSPYHDAEAINRTVTAPDIREIRRVTSAYGRLLVLSHAEVPLEALEHIQDMWKRLSIARVSTTLRIVGQSQVEMAARGLDTPFGHLLDYFGIATGRKLGTDILGEELTAAKAAGITDEARNIGTTSWANDLKQARREVIPYYDPRFATGLADDIYNLHIDPVARRIAGYESVTRDPISEAKTWLASDAPDALQYRLDNGITPDNLSSYVQNLSNTIKTKTLSQDSLMSAIRDGEHAPGSPIYTQNDQGARHLTGGFKNHINSLVEKGLTPDETIGEILPRVSDATKNLYSNVLDKWLNKVLIGPINNWVSNPAIRQYYYQELAHTLPLMTEDAQATALKAASDAGLDAKSVTKLASVAAQRAGDLTAEEGNVLTTSRATRELKRTLYDMHDRKQVLDIMRLIFPFGNAWAQQLKEWAELVKDRPNIIPRAETLIHGAEGSGFFFVDPKSIQYDANGKPIPGTGTESFGYPGSAFVTKLLTGAPFTLSSPVSSLNMFSQNPLMPGFGPIAQTAIGHIIPDKPQFLELKKMVAPFGTPEGLSGFIPSYLKKVQTAFSSPDSDRAFANTVMDTAKYLESTGRYDLNSTDDQIKLEDAARSMAKRIYLFRSVAQFALPSSPTPDDVVKDASGQSVLTFKMSQDYYDLVNDDKLNHTNLAVSRFIDEYGTKNILGMQSITQGDSPLNSKGYAWVLDNPDIARKYADVYSYFAPAGGGRSQQAYDMLFDKGKRKILSVSEAMQAANARVATMVYDHLKESIGPKRTEAQSQWLESKKALLIQKYPGWNPDYVGTKTPQRIRQLQDAVNDPKLANNPVTPALQAYFHFRDQAAQAAGIVGWNTAASTKATRDWLRAKAAFLASRVPEFQSVFDDLLSRELKDDG